MSRPTLRWPSSTLQAARYDAALACSTRRRRSSRRAPTSRSRSARCSSGRSGSPTRSRSSARCWRGTRVTRRRSTTSATCWRTAASGSTSRSATSSGRCRSIPTTARSSTASGGPTSVRTSSISPRTNLKKAAEQRVRDSAIQDHFGDLLFKLGRYQDAASAWQRALDGDMRAGRSRGAREEAAIGPGQDAEALMRRRWALAALLARRGRRVRGAHRHAADRRGRRRFPTTRRRWQDATRGCRERPVDVGRAVDLRPRRPSAAARARAGRPGGPGLDPPRSGRPVRPAAVHPRRRRDDDDAPAAAGQPRAPRRIAGGDPRRARGARARSRGPAGHPLGVRRARRAGHGRPPLSLRTGRASTWPAGPRPTCSATQQTGWFVRAGVRRALTINYDPGGDAVPVPRSACSPTARAARRPTCGSASRRWPSTRRSGRRCSA